ncbi:hypothetical protein [Mucilaginibacter antarcticus]|uniref:Uncharacterized protein n=1 Tax=Mucilaginibacter antarcticus TaxID=1855725 RepID=A0ABW5XVA4_9SPHI
MKKVSLSVLTILFAATSIFANVPVKAKKVKAKQATCTSCPKGQKCPKTVCAEPTSCCK